MATERDSTTYGYLKSCLHQPCDKYFLANSYDLKRKPIASKSQRRNTIRRDRTAAVRCSYDCRTTVVRALRDLRIANSHGRRTNSDNSLTNSYCSRTNSQNFIATLVRPARIRTAAVRLSYELAERFFMHVFLHANIFQTPITFNVYLFLAVCYRSDDLKYT